MNAGIYLRVSSEDQAQHGYSLMAQRDSCVAKARALGAVEVSEFADEGVPGTLLDRPGLGALRQAVARRAVDIVVIYDPDRFARSLAHQLLVTEEIERAGVRLEFVNFEWQNTPEGKLFYAMRGAFAEYEREKIRIRTSTGRIQKARQGKLPMVVEPYGYRYDAQQSLLVVDPYQSEIVRRIFSEIVDHGEGLNGIAKLLTRDRVPTQKGHSIWHRQVVRQIARNPVYMGIFYANRLNTAGMGINRFRSVGDKVRPSIRPREEWIPIRVPPIVDPQTWHRAQMLMDQRAAEWQRQRHGTTYLLSGLLRCEICGQTMTGRQRKNWGRLLIEYSCRKNTAGDRAPGCARRPRVDAGQVESIVWNRVMDWIDDPKRFGEMFWASDALERLNRETETAQINLERILAGQRNLLNVLAGGIGDSDIVVQRLNALQEREQAVMGQLQQLKHAHGEIVDLRLSQDPEFSRRWLRRARQELPRSFRYTIVHALVQEILIGDETMTILPRTSN